MLLEKALVDSSLFLQICVCLCLLKPQPSGSCIDGLILGAIYVSYLSYDREQERPASGDSGLGERVASATRCIEIPLSYIYV